MYVEMLLQHLTFTNVISCKTLLLVLPSVCDNPAVTVHFWLSCSGVWAHLCWKNTHQSVLITLWLHHPLRVCAFMTSMLQSCNMSVCIFTWPVLKHGPRSLASVQTDFVYRLVCNENVCSMMALPINYQLVAYLNVSIVARTRKMVNYACITWIQRKLWWKFVSVLTCKSFVTIGYRGERLIEPSSSWFLSKFPSG